MLVFCKYFSNFNKNQQEMGKVKKENDDGNESKVKDEDLYDEKVKNANKIACPMASKKLTKKCYKLIKKGEPNFIVISHPLFINLAFCSCKAENISSQRFERCSKQT